MEFPDEIRLPFFEQSTSLCTFLGFHISPLKYKTENYNHICLIGRSKPADGPISVQDGTMAVEFHFEPSEYLKHSKGSDKELQEYFIAILKKRLPELSDYLPAPAMLEGLDAFRQNGYKNEWRIGVKSLGRGTKSKVEAWVLLTSKKFSLRLRVVRQGETISEKEVYQSKPNPFLWSYKVRALKFVADESTVTLTNFYSEEIHTLNIREFVG